MVRAFAQELHIGSYFDWIKVLVVTNKLMGSVSIKMPAYRETRRAAWKSDLYDMLVGGFASRKPMLQANQHSRKVIPIRTF